MFEALNRSNSVLPLFIFDTEILEKLPSKEDKRVVFIHQTICALQNELLKVGGSMLVMHGSPVTVFEKLLEEYAITSVYANSDYEPSTIKRDATIPELLKRKGIAFKLYKDQVIFEKAEIVKSDGSPFQVFTPYSRAWKHQLSQLKLELFPSENLLNNFNKAAPNPIPSLDEIGFKNIEIRTRQPVVDKNVIREYPETRNFPYLNGTSNLSVHLRFGTISVRGLVKIALDLNEEFLNETGLMHNRVRMIVASFLTKHLLIDWRWGEAYFAEKLLDFELSSNNGNWQWSAGCGCDAAPYFRVFNPYEQVKKFDPDLIYTRKWVKNLFESDYPAPIVEHKFARERFLKVFRATLGNSII